VNRPQSVENLNLTMTLTAHIRGKGNLSSNDIHGNMEVAKYFP